VRLELMIKIEIKTMRRINSFLYRISKSLNGGLSGIILIIPAP